MRLLRGALAIILLLALLTWLLLRGIDPDAPAYAVTLRAFDDFAIAEASLHRDVLQARTGLLGDYDSPVRALATMEDSVDSASTLRPRKSMTAWLTDLLRQYRSRTN